MVSKATTGYICNMEIYTAEGKKLETTIFCVLQPNLDLWHHVHQDNYYNSVAIAEHLLQRKTRVLRYNKKQQRSSKVFRTPSWQQFESRPEHIL